jgi:hypothetical protein
LKTPEQAEAFANKFGECEQIDMELYKYLGFDDYPTRSENLDHGGQNGFILMICQKHMTTKYISM